MGKTEVIADIEMVLTEAISNKNSYIYMLDTISKFHKYNLSQQASLSIYALPIYTAVADERIWAQGFNAHLKQDAHAIEILDDNMPNGIKTVYDVSDTDLPRDRCEKLLWRFDTVQHNNVFRGIATGGTTSVDSILQVCWQIEDYLSGEALRKEEIQLLSGSIGYIILKRCGFEREASLLAEQTISDELLQTSNISLEDVSNISREILNGIQTYIQKGKEYNEDFPLQDAMKRVQNIISSHIEVSNQEQPGNILSVKAAATEEKAAITAVPEEAIVLTESPVITTETDAGASIRVDTDEISLSFDKSQESDDLTTETITASADTDVSNNAYVKNLEPNGNTSEAEKKQDSKFHGGRKGETFQRNIKAIRVLKTLEKEQRPVKDTMEKNALLEYSGFGNLSEVFDEKNKGWQAERDLLKSLLTNEEYIAARSSVLSAFYTDTDIISAIYDGVSRMGFSNGNILEPSCGVGNFFSYMPESIRNNSHLFGIELDPLSGRIAQQLHPDADITIQGFETTTFPEGSFDLTITNVPFENYKIRGRSVHDYFLLKMVEQTRPGGLMVAITSRYSMDKKDPDVREELARQADLIKAIRLPNTTFRETGAEATTDILVFQRREQNLNYSDPLPDWVNTVHFDDDPSINVNSYFIQHPEDVIGILTKKSTAYGFDLTCKPKDNVKNTKEIATEISKALASVHSGYIPLTKSLPIPEQKQNEKAAVYSFFVTKEGLVSYRGTDSTDIKTLESLGIKENDTPQIRKLMRIRDLTREVIRSQQFTDDDSALHVVQERLVNTYNDYVKTYGDLHTKKVKELFEDDCSYPLLLSLEVTDVKGKVTGISDIFTKRTIRPHVPPSHVDTAQEALIVSITEHGKIDLSYMERLTGMDKEKLVKDLEYTDLFYDDHTGSYLPADEYLSGDIREKIEELEQKQKSIQEQRDNMVWESLIPTMSKFEVYIPKNEIEKRILDDSTVTYFSNEAKSYIKKVQDWDFCFAFLDRADASSYYWLSNQVFSNPLFCIEAGLRYGTNFDETPGVRLLAEIVDALHIKKVKPGDGAGHFSVLEFLHDGTDIQYPQKRVCIQYLRQLLKDYDGTNSEEIVERAKEEWPTVWQEWENKFQTTVKENVLTGLSQMNHDLERIEKNLAALKSVCPKDLEAQDISVRLGAPWIPVSDIKAFMEDTFGDSVAVEYCDVNHGQWKINFSRTYGLSRYNEKAKEYSTPAFDAAALLEKILNLQPAIVKDKVIIGGKEKEVINQEKTVLAQQKQEMIKEAFVNWVWKNEERKNRLVKYYNRHFNNIRPREFDGSHLVFPGMNPEIQLRSHQKDAIAHTLFGGNTLLAHCVGAGKTFEMVASIMESKRLGLSNKAMLVVPGHLTEQMGAEFMRLYPTANILVATKKDFEKSRRKEFCAKIATHNWDAVILGFTQFEKIAMSPEYMGDFTKKELSRLETEIEIASKQGGKSFSVRQMERLRKNLQGKLEAMQNTKTKDDVINFEDLGIDRLYVDEAHNFKNLGIITKLSRMPGISSTSAQKSVDFYQKVQYMNNKTNCKGVVFATGTAISNSMTELYVMQQYLRPDRLESEGIRHFDTWATTFGEIANVQELNPEGKGIRLRQRFSKFSNLPELMSMVKEFADIKTQDMLNLPTPNVKYHVESVPASPEQKAMVDELAERAIAIRNKTADPASPKNNMLSVTTEGRKLALDQRILNPDLPDYPGSKVNRCIANVFRIWEESKKSKGTQLIFSDFSTPDDKRFNVYADIKEKLIAKGVPISEIAFIHDANNEKQKEELFAKVRAGKVRILLGSTSKLGTGTNVQDKLVASHDLDVPWKPSDLEQRKGRIARQGNENSDVEVYRYVTEGTFDSYMWQILENKQRFISQILTSKLPARVTEDADELVLSCAEVKAIATGSPLIREKMELEVETERLKIVRKGFLAEQTARKKFIEITGPKRIVDCERNKMYAEIDCETITSFATKNKGTLIILGGKAFTDEKEAGKAIVEAIRSGHGKELTGQYKGMKFLLSAGLDWKMQLVGKMRYSIEVHMGSYAENIKRLAALEEQITAYPKVMETEILNIHKQMDEARELSAHAFSKEDIYQQKISRLQEIDLLLNEENNRDNSAISEEEEHRRANLSSFLESDDTLKARYAKVVLDRLAIDELWNETKDQDIAEDCLRAGFFANDIVEILLHISPKVYDVATVKHIVSEAKKASVIPDELSACK